MTRKILPAFLLLAILYSFTLQKDLKGTWEYGGGTYNGKTEDGPKNYILQRKYDAAHYEAYLIEAGQKPMVYEKGNYSLRQDTCLETQTYSSQPSKVLNVTINYQYMIKNDTLIFSGILPNGTVVKEYWKKIK